MMPDYDSDYLAGERDGLAYALATLEHAPSALRARHMIETRLAGVERRLGQAQELVPPMMPERTEQDVQVSAPAVHRWGSDGARLTVHEAAVELRKIEAQV